ncbi:MAG: hypothetical protein ABI583_09845 [Betaproteobacteria bacterium]
MNKYLCTLVLVSICGLFTGCSTIYSRIEGDFDVATTALNDYPVKIVAIDGTYQIAQSAPIEPGAHNLILTSKKPTHFHNREQKAFPLMVEPCNRYYLAARHASKLTEDFEMIVRRVEPIAGCDLVSAASKSVVDLTAK